MMKIDDTALILIDFQGKLATIMHESEELLANIVRLVKGAQILGIPIIWLEQYPKGLGSTVDEVRTLLEGDHEPIAKMSFNSFLSPEFKETIDTLDKKHFLVAGIEAHICVYQTVCGLLREGKHVEFVEEAISSRTASNKQIAIDKMNRIGAFPTSVEMALFELIETAEHPHFKEISALIK